MALKPHPTDPDKAVFVKNEYDFGPRWKDITNAELVEELRRRKILETVFPKDEWQGLTDDESIGLLQKAAKHKSPNYCTAPEMAVEFGRLASEALKEKNNG